MNGNSVYEKNLMRDALESATVNVLETMFFAEASLLTDHLPHVAPLACILCSTGAEHSTFGVTIDRGALSSLCESFYGDIPTPTQPAELLCELTNMIAGSALSVYSPSQICPLSSPELCGSTLPRERFTNSDTTELYFEIEGGLLSIMWSLD